MVICFFKEIEPVARMHDTISKGNKIGETKKSMNPFQIPRFHQSSLHIAYPTLPIIRSLFTPPSSHLHIPQQGPISFTTQGLSRFLNLRFSDSACLSADKDVNVKKWTDGVGLEKVLRRGWGDGGRRVEGEGSIDEGSMDGEWSGEGDKELVTGLRMRKWGRETERNRVPPE